MRHGERRWIVQPTECGLGLTASDVVVPPRLLTTSETTRLSLRSRRNRRSTVALSPGARCGFCLCELSCAFTPGNPLESEPGARFTSAPSNSIVERAADAVDVIDDSDRQRGLSAETPSLRREARRFSRAVECAQ